MTSWAEHMKHDPALRAFVQGECNRAVVDLAALKVEYEHLQNVVKALQADKARLELALKEAGKAERRRR